MWHLLKCLTVPSPAPLPCSHEAFGPDRPSNLWVLTITLTLPAPNTPLPLTSCLSTCWPPPFSRIISPRKPSLALGPGPAPVPMFPLHPALSRPENLRPAYLLTGDLLQTRSSGRQQSCLECSKRTRNERMNGVTRFCFLPSTGRLTPGWCWDCGSFPLYVVILLIWCHGIQMSASMLDSPAGPWAAGGTGVLNSLVHSPIHTCVLTRVFFFLCFSSQIFFKLPALSKWTKSSITVSMCM